MKIEGLDALSRKLQSLEQFQRTMRAPMEAAVSVVRRDIAQVPRKSKGAFTRYATAAQKRAYWAQVRKGTIGHDSNGYVRTNALRNRWTSEVQTTTGGVRGVVGNNEPHAVFVQGDRQQKFHAVSGWRKADKVVKYNRDKVQRIFQRAISRELNK